MRPPLTVPNRLLWLAIATLALACTDPTATGTAAVEWRRYALLEVDGEPLPGLVFATTTDSVHVLSDTLVFDEAGTVTVRSRVRRILGAAPAETLSTSATLPYTLVGDSVHLNGIVCVVGPCPGAPRGAISESELWLVRFDTSPLRSYRYVRLHAGH